MICLFFTSIKRHIKKRAFNRRLKALKYGFNLKQDFVLLKSLFNSNRNGNGHTDHRVVTCSDKSHHFNVCLGNDEPSEYAGAKQARQILEQVAALFASGTMTNEDKTIFMDEMTRLYLASKKNRRKW